MCISFYYLSWDSYTFGFFVHPGKLVIISWNRVVFFIYFLCGLLLEAPKTSMEGLCVCLEPPPCGAQAPPEGLPCPRQSLPDAGHAEPSPPPCRGDGLLLALSPLILPFTRTFPLLPVDLPFLATAKCVFHFVGVVEDCRCSLVALNLKLVSVFVFFVVLYNSRRK